MGMFLLIVVTEIFGVVLFILGYLVGSQTKLTLKNTPNPEEIPDPVSPSEQLLLRKLEEAQRYGLVQEE